VVNGNWSRTWNGDRQLTAAPISAARVHDSYSLPAGQIRLDLSRVRDPASLDGREIDVHGNVGEIIVTLPPHVGADVNADVDGPGDITVPGRDTGGIGAHVDRTVVPVSEVAHLDLNLDLSVGHIEVRQ
jgi:hypothetical protein